MCIPPFHCWSSTTKRKWASVLCYAKLIFRPISFIISNHAQPCRQYGSCRHASERDTVSISVQDGTANRFPDIEREKGPALPD